MFILLIPSKIAELLSCVIMNSQIPHPGGLQMNQPGQLQQNILASYQEAII